jgi:hypothetical protein
VASEGARSSLLVACAPRSVLTAVCPPPRCRVLSCFKLNPFEFLNLRFDASPEDVRRQYRKVRGLSAVPLPVCSCATGAVVDAHSPPQISLMVHPDKCRHPRSRDAFEGACACCLLVCRLALF